MKISVIVVLLSIIIICCIYSQSSASTLEPKAHVSGNFGITQLQTKRFSLLISQQTGDSTRVYSSESLKLKDPKMAVAYAFIPGLIVHGSGHFYAEDSRTGTRLLLTEAVGGGLIFVGVVFTMAGSPTIAGFAALSGAILFVGSWVYDVVGAPLAVQKYNKNLLEKNPVGLEFKMKDQQPVFSVVWRF